MNLKPVSKVVFAVVFVVSIFLISSSFAATDPQPVYQQNEIQYSPDIHEGVVIWARNDKDVEGYNLNIQNYFSVCSESKDQKHSAIAEDYAVWTDTRNGNYDIFAKDLVTGDEISVCTLDSLQVYPSISGNIIVWQDRRSENDYDIYGYDLSTDTEFVICDDPSNQYYPFIFGNKVVWHDTRNGDADIFYYNLDTGQTTAVCTASGHQMRPKVYQNYIVWQDARSSDYDIYCHDLDSGNTFVVCDAAEDQQNPAIFGDIIVWQDKRTGENNIRGYKISGSTEFVICDDTGQQIEPEIYNNIVVWEHEISIYRNIYYIEIVEPTSFDITKPNGGEMLLAGSNLEITWDISGEPADNVVLKYSDDNGSNWNVIDANAPETGNYIWDTNDVADSNEYLVKISRKDDPSLSDVSDSNFTIFQCSEDLDADTNGDCIVDFKDLLDFCAQWLKSGNPYDENWKP